MLYSNCLPVKGVKRSIIYDLQKCKYDFIPNDLFTILKKYSHKKIKNIYNGVESEQHYILDEYVGFLMKNDYLILADNIKELSNFPPLDLKWDNPSIITNAILDLSNKNIDIIYYKNLLYELEDLGCLFLEIRIWGNYDVLIFYEELLIFIEELNINTIELIIPFEPGFNYSNYNNLQNSYSKINKIIVYNSSPSLVNEINRENNDNNSTNIFATTERINDQTHCGVVSPFYFTVNESLFTESLFHNTCLNRKIGIDSQGEIKNCPTLSNSFGNIQSDNIKEIVNKTEFKKFWFINKDQIETCKVCEFRHMCSDCRAFTQNDLEKPAKCGYNPFTCEWDDLSRKKF